MGARSENVSLYRRAAYRPTLAASRTVQAAGDQLQALLTALGDRSTPCAEDPAPWADVESPQDVRAAEAACLDCPVMQECGAYGDALRVRVGVWGGQYRGPRHTYQHEPNTTDTEGELTA